MQAFIHNSASSGIVLMLGTVVALVLANSPLAAAYDALLHMYIGIAVGPFQLKHSLLHWINDGFMAVFFFLVGLEIKRGIFVGELSNLRAAMLPIIAALGGRGRAGSSLHNIQLQPARGCWLGYSHGYRHRLCFGIAGSAGQSHSLWY